jgi:hypothetical protein
MFRGLRSSRAFDSDYFANSLQRGNGKTKKNQSIFTYCVLKHSVLARVHQRRTHLHTSGALNIDFNQFWSCPATVCFAIRTKTCRRSRFPRDLPRRLRSPYTRRASVSSESQYTIRKRRAEPETPKSAHHPVFSAGKNQFEAAVTQS